jgi:Mlc titration factor MtfA (ptsG expression regulator)
LFVPGSDFFNMLGPAPVPDSHPSLYKIFTNFFQQDNFWPKSGF